MAESKILFERVTILGIGLIGSSLVRAMRQQGVVRHVTVVDFNEAHRARSLETGLADGATADVAEGVKDADLVVFATPLGAFAALAAAMRPALKAGAIVTDVGSVKQTAIADIQPHIPHGVHFVPGHPIAGTEHSGPDAGFAELFQGRYCLLTPLPDCDPEAVAQVAALWRRCGATVETMEPAHHDRVLAITSHLPHLIAFTIVGTAADLAEDLKQEVIRYSASGFRDFTRIAASDPVMWRDIFLNNREAVLEIIQRFTEDLTALQRAIRKGEGEVLQDLFARTRAIRRGVVDIRQA